MDYNKIYNEIILKARDRKLEGYREKHHIIPKCMGGSDDKENIVILTAKEHYLCHRLLVEMYPSNFKLKFAYFMLAGGVQSENQQRNYKTSARIYERLKKENALLRSELQKGKAPYVMTKKVAKKISHTNKTKGIKPPSQKGRRYKQKKKRGPMSLKEREKRSKSIKKSWVKRKRKYKYKTEKERKVSKNKSSQNYYNKNKEIIKVKSAYKRRFGKYPEDMNEINSILGTGYPNFETASNDLEFWNLWKEKGSDYYGVFDLRPNSLSWRMFNKNSPITQ